MVRTSLAGRLSGHFWTVAPQPTLPLPRISAAGRRPTRFEMVALDEQIGPVRLTGWLDVPEGARTLALVIHGLGGDARRSYIVRLARAARSAGIATLCLNLRGADGLGEDFYHAGLAADLHTALSTEAVRLFEHVVLVGFSLGGHVALSYATTTKRDPRIRAVAAICAPLDLERGARAIDARDRTLYRWVILSSLKRAYAAVARRRPVPAPVRAVARIDTLREWDGHTVVPRYGFASAEDYYARVSVAPHLADLELPALLVYARHDPIVPWHTVEPALAGASAAARVVCLDRGAGHVGFLRKTDLDEPAPKGLEAQTLAWLGARCTSSA